MAEISKSTKTSGELEEALKLLEEGKTTVSKGAEIAGMDVWSFVSKIKERNIRWVKEDILEGDLEAFRKEG